MLAQPYFGSPLMLVQLYTNLIFRETETVPGYYYILSGTVSLTRPSVSDRAWCLSRGRSFGFIQLHTAEGKFDISGDGNQSTDRAISGDGESLGEREFRCVALTPVEFVVVNYRALQLSIDNKRHIETEEMVNMLRRFPFLCKVTGELGVVFCASSVALFSTNESS
jgi:hypothetical protein